MRPALLRSMDGYGTVVRVRMVGAWSCDIFRSSAVFGELFMQYMMCMKVHGA